MRAHASWNRNLMYALLGLLVLLLLWFLFRPERLWINKRVNEPPPHSALNPAPSMIVSVTPHLQTGAGIRASYGCGSL